MSVLESLLLQINYMITNNINEINMIIIKKFKLHDFFFFSFTCYDLKNTSYK